MIRAAGITLLAALSAVPFCPQPRADPLTELEARGKQIYREGRDSRGGEITAAVGQSGLSLSAIMLPCANCHGDDGLGRAEGAVRPPNITWAELTKPYGHMHAGRRTHPAFDAAAIGRAITGGIDPAGNRLDPAMPRYDMAETGVQAVVAYLQRLSADLDPGLSATAIRIATVALDAGPRAPASDAATETIRAYFDDVNATGGIFGRKIELTVADTARDAGPTLANAHKLAERQGSFAVIDIFNAGLQRDLLLGPDGVPRIAAFNPPSGGKPSQGGTNFFLLSGLLEQARALVGFAAGELDLSAPRTAVVVPGGDTYPDLAEAIESAARARGWPAPKIVHIADGREMARQVSELRQLEIEAVFYFGPARDLPAFAAEAAKGGWRPYLFLSGGHIGRSAFDVPPPFGDRVFLAYPSVPSDRTSLTSVGFEGLRRRHGLSQQYPAARAVAYAAAAVMVEGLRRSGRAVSRAGFIAALEGLTDFETGAGPLISFGPNRRVGALGAYVVGIDPGTGHFGSDITWIQL